ncbi:S1 family peptidase [Entomobacter blattae]|uniref:Trypsin-like peptidase domain protein n=1 Tax=Entomobacter blattae TaxID=2762277 RepID=A0A7H1NQD3_9PROT|nr:serine protease [Entomobacter blattae]QNT77993.1 Trypsin-like peptidase domain protein [Entomobacter blattae]
MALYTLGKTPLENIFQFQVNGSPIQTLYTSLTAQLRQLQQKGNTLLLAEPVITPASSTGAASIAWYYEGSAQPIAFTSLTPSEQETLKTQLTQNLALLFPPEKDPDPLLLQAFSILSLEKIFVADGFIILTQWGLSPLSFPAQTPIPFKDSPLGQLITAVPPSPQPEPAAPSPKAPPYPTPPPFLPTPATPWTSWARWLLRPVTYGLIICTFFAIGFFLGQRLIWAEHPTQIAHIPTPQARALALNDPAQQKKNAQLAQEVQSLQEQLKHPTCDLTQNRVAPGLNHLLPTKAAPNQKDGQPFAGSLARLLSQSTVLVLALSDKGISLGSGFFVTPDTIVTNRHVIALEHIKLLAVTNKQIGRLIPASIENTPMENIDLAVLKVTGIPPQQPLALTRAANPLDDVVAAGYPGMLMRNDGNFEKLLKGDIESIPGIILTKGQINAIQTDRSGLPILPHSATVSKGNSGGPLVDMCGRVVGINTFVTSEKETSSHGNYALKSDILITALQNSGIPITVKEGACTLETPTSPSLPPASPPSAAPAPTPSAENKTGTPPTVGELPKNPPDHNTGAPAQPAPNAQPQPNPGTTPETKPQ